MKADKALERISHDAGEYREQGPGHGKRAGGCGQQRGAWCDGVHAVPPCAEPDAEWKGGDRRLLREHARDHAPSVTMPGVACLTQSPPMPAAIDPVAISAVAAGVPG